MNHSCVIMTAIVAANVDEWVADWCRAHYTLQTQRELTKYQWIGRIYKKLQAAASFGLQWWLLMLTHASNASGRSGAKFRQGVASGV